MPVVLLCNLLQYVTSQHKMWNGFYSSVVCECQYMYFTVPNCWKGEGVNSNFPRKQMKHFNLLRPSQLVIKG